MAIDRDNYPLRKPCACGATMGHIVVRNGQNTVWCNDCNTYAGFNAPKSETGEPQRSVRTREAIKPSKRSEILIRDGHRCVLCHVSDQILHIGHIVSLEAGRLAGLTDEELDDDENLGVMCEECNLGIGKQPLPLRTAIAILKARIAWVNRGRG